MAIDIQIYQGKSICWYWHISIFKLKKFIKQISFKYSPRGINVMLRELLLKVLLYDLFNRNRLNTL